MINNYQHIFGLFGQLRGATTRHPLIQIQEYLEKKIRKKRHKKKEKKRKRDLCSFGFGCEQGCSFQNKRFPIKKKKY